MVADRGRSSGFPGFLSCLPVRWGADSGNFAKKFLFAVKQKSQDHSGGTVADFHSLPYYRPVRGDHYP